MDKARTLATTLDSNSSSKVEEHTLAKLPLTTHQAQLPRPHQHPLLLERILIARLRRAITSSMALNPDRVSLMDRTSNKAPTSPTMRTSNNLLAANSMVASSILAQPSRNTARISNSTAPVPPTEAINSSRVRISSMAETRSEGARICRTTTRSLLPLQEVHPSKDSMDSSISPLLLDSNHSFNHRVIRVILILKPTEANSAVHLTSMPSIPSIPRATMRPQLVVPNSILLPRLEDLPEDITLPTVEVMGTSSPLTVISLTKAAAALLLFLTEAILNNNMEDLTEGLTRSCTEKPQTPIFSPVVKKIWSFSI